MAPAYRLSLDGVSHEVEVREENGRLTVVVDGKCLAADFRRINGSLMSLLLDNQSFEMVAVEQPGGYEVVIGNQPFEIEVERSNHGRHAGGRAVAGIDGAGEVQLRTPMTGVVIEVMVAAGTQVSAGQVVVIVESMKMNNELRAPREGTIESIHVQPGDRVERNMVVATIR